MRILKTLVLTLAILFSLIPLSASAQGVWQACTDVKDETSSSAICEDKTEASDIVKNLINVALFIIGALSVVMILHSGFKYVISRGDSEKIKSAKDTLLYAVIGLIVAILAFTIVNFVIGVFSQTGTNTGVDNTNDTNEQAETSGG